MPRWTEESKKQHSLKLKGRTRTEQQKKNISNGRKKKTKSSIERFLSSKVTKAALGKNVLDEVTILALEKWFEVYPVEKSYWWFDQLCRWINLGMLDFVEQRQLSERRLSKETFIIKYGEQEGERLYNLWATRDNYWRVEYWMAKGMPLQAAQQQVSLLQRNNSLLNKNKRKDIGGQRQFSVRCAEFFIRYGFDEHNAIEEVAKRQRRDLDFFTAKYGLENGIFRYEESKLKRKATWETKDKQKHAEATLNYAYNPNGREAKAIEMFIQQNNLNSYRCIYGAPKDQFQVFIPGVGLRRYDLAVLDGNQLMIIFEYHGPLHVNFSDFREDMRYMHPMDKGRILRYGNTIGEIYENDQRKKNYITTVYSGVLYLVAWPEDFKRKDLRIDTLQRRLQDRLS